MVSPFTGISPFPSLPVLSASNCSTQYPKAEIEEDITNVTLSRPFFWQMPSVVPRLMPGLDAAGISGPQLVSICSARASISFTSIPINAIGSMPK